MKTAIFWTAKGCRKPKMVGTATADCSTLTIEDYRVSARRGQGTLYIVDCETAADAREMIAKYRLAVKGAEFARLQNLSEMGQLTRCDDSKTVAIGPLAVKAIAGAALSKARWDRRIASQGRVKLAQSRALGGDDS